MKRTAVASVLVLAMAVPALAATKFYVVKDTVNNCSVVEGGTSAGLTPIANAEGYDSEEAASKALDEIRDSDDCAGVVE